MTATAQSPATTVLLLGATGRTGGRVLTGLLERDVTVRAVVRSADRLPAAAAGDPRLTVTVAEITSLSDAELAAQVQGCDAVISCLGHTITARGVFGPPRDLVTATASRVCRAARETGPARPLRFILMSTVSVNRPGRQDMRRGGFERAALWLLRALIPPAKDNQGAADFLLEAIGTDAPWLQWVAVRPDSLCEGDVTAYEVHDGLVDSIFRPGHTRMANVAAFMCELATDADTWAAWRGKLPVIVDAPTADDRPRHGA